MQVIRKRSMITVISELAGFIGIAVATVMLFFARKRVQEANLSLARSKEKWHSSKREIETERKEALLKVKDEIYRRRNEF